jgi:hypothetical protein
VPRAPVLHTTNTRQSIRKAYAIQLSRGEVGIPLDGSTPPHLCTYHKPGHSNLIRRSLLIFSSPTAILPLCSIYRHGGHDGWSAGSSDIGFKGNPLRMIQAKFGLNWPSGFRGEDFLKSHGRRTPSDGNSSYRCANMFSMSRSTYPAILK